jgi:hypothetical protein
MTGVYFMSSEEEKAALGDILDRYNEAKRHLIALQFEADKLAGKLSELAELLRHGPPYPILPATGFLDALRVEKLFKVLHDTYEQKTVLGQRLKDLE